MFRFRWIVLSMILPATAWAEPPAEAELPPGALVRLGSLRFRHNANVRFAAFALDGKSIIGCGFDGMYRSWELESGKLIKEMRLAGGHISNLRLSPDQKQLAVIDNNSGVQVWNTETGRSVWRMPSQRFGDVAIDWLPDGKQVVVASREGFVRLFDAGNGQVTKDVQIKLGQVQTIAVSPDGKSITIGGYDGRVSQPALICFDIVNDKEGVKFELPDRSAGGYYYGMPNALAYSPDGKWFTMAMPGPRGGVTIWDAKTGKVAHRLGVTPANAPVAYPMGIQATALAFSPNSRFVAAAGNDFAVRVYGLASGRELRVLEGQRTPVSQLAFSPDGQRILVGRANQMLQLWDVPAGRELGDEVGHRGPISAVLFLDDGKRLFTAGGDSTFRLWDTSSGREAAPPIQLYYTTNFTAFALDTDRQTVLYANNSPSIQSWKLERGIEQPPFVPGAGYMLSHLAPDGSTAAGHAGANSIRVVDAAGKDLRTISCRSYPQQMALSPGGRYLAANDASGEQSIRLWNIASGRETKFPDQEPGARFYPYKMQFSPDARFLAVVVSTVQSYLQVYEAATGLVRWSFVLPPSIAPNALAFSDDGRLLAVGLSDGSLRLLDTATGAAAVTPVAHRGVVYALAFSPGETLLASGSADTTAIIWDVAKLRRGLPATPAGRTEAEHLEAAWADLGASDGARAHAAVWTLAAAPEPTLALIRLRRTAAPTKPTNEQIAQWIKELDDDRFVVRKKAVRALAAAGADAKTVLTAALETAGPDAHRSLEMLIKNLSEGKNNAKLHPLRLAEVLERVGTPDARTLVEELAKQTVDADAKEEIAKTLERMNGKK